MKKKSLKTSAYAVGVLASLLTYSTGAFAQIPTTAFKGYSKHFKKNKELYDPVIGAASLGFMQNARKFGGFTPTFDDKQQRVYIQDASDTAVCNLFKILFPSPTGQLTTERAIETDFGKNIVDPKTPALLMNFSNDLRTGKTIDENKVIHDILDSFHKDYKEPPNPILPELQAVVDDLTEPKAGKRFNLDPIKKKNAQVWKALNQDITKIANIAGKDLNTKKSEIKSLIHTYFQEKEEKTIREKKENFEKEITNATLKPLLGLIKQSIKEEKDSLYLPYATEQVISSFFCRHFNTQGDIRKFIKNLDDSIVDKTNLPQADDDLQETDLDPMARKAGPLDLDEIFALSAADIWGAITPYREDTTLLSNGNTYRYARKEDKLVATGGSFADCAEMGDRHVMNLLLYNNLGKKYDLTHLKKKIQPDNPYFKNFEAFYEKYTPASANAGDIETRSNWNKVVGDLNALDPSNPIQYMKGTNELNAGFINFIRTFQKIFGLTLEDLPKKDWEAKKKWLTKALHTLFNTINPTRSYGFDLSKVYEKDGDLSGSISITVGNQDRTEELFSFDFRSVPNVHADVTNLKMLKKMGEKDYTADLKTHATRLEAGTAEEAVWLAAPRELRDSKLKNPLYQLFQTPLEDNDSKIALLKKVRADFGKWRGSTFGSLLEKAGLGGKPFLSTEAKLQSFKAMLGNVLDDISWSDLAVLKQLSPVLVDLAKETDLQDVLAKNVQGFYWSGSHTHFVTAEDNPLENIKFFKSVKYLELDQANMQHLNLTGFNELKILDIREANIKKLTLNSLPKLERVKFPGGDMHGRMNYQRRKYGIEEIELENLNSLKQFNIASGFLGGTKGDGYEAIGVKKLSLKSLASFEKLDLSQTNYLETVNLENLPNITDIKVHNSSVKELKGLKTLTNLKHLSVFNSRQLPELDLEGLTQLTSFELSEPDFRQNDLPSAVKVKGLETLINLESLTLTELHNFRTLSLQTLTKLSDINLSGSSVQHIKGLQALTSLERLQLHDVRKLQDLDLENLTQLKELDLASSPVQEIKGFKTLTNLTKLSLRSNPHLQVPDLESASQLTDLSLSRSSLQEIKGFKALKSLERLNVSEPDLQELDLEGKTQLTTLNMDSSGITKLKNLKDATALEELSLMGTKNLNELEIDNLSQLSKLDMGGSAVTKVKGTNLENLTDLNLSNTDKLGDLELDNLSQLSKLDMDGSAVTKIKAKNLINLQELDLRGKPPEYDVWDHWQGLKNLAELELENLPQLLTLELTDSSIKNIKGLNTLENLGTLDLRKAKKIKTLEFTENRKNLKIKLRGSGIKNRTQIKGIEYLNEKNITW